VWWAQLHVGCWNWGSTPFNDLRQRIGLRCKILRAAWNLVCVTGKPTLNIAREGGGDGSHLRISLHGQGSGSASRCHCGQPYGLFPDSQALTLGLNGLISRSRRSYLPPIRYRWLLEYCKMNQLRRLQEVRASGYLNYVFIL
jgi:hypothetical protein